MRPHSRRIVACVDDMSSKNGRMKVHTVPHSSLSFAIACVPRVCVCVRVCACACACVCVRVCVCVCV
jgi:hypothetical protein